MKKKHFIWPTNQNIELDNQLKLLKHLISYSTNLNKLETFSKELNLDLLDGLLETQPLINEFNRKKSISTETINRYHIFLKSRLMIDLIKNNLTKYFNTQNIIMFFNQFNDINKSIESYWMIKAQKLSKKYSSDFFISLPDFSQTDIIFLLVNPMEKAKGFIFEGIDIPDQLFNDLYELSIKITSFSQIRNEIFEIIKKYVKQNYPKEYKQFLQSKAENFDDFLKQIQERNLFTKDLQSTFSAIQTAIEIGSKIPSEIDFESVDYSDFEDLNILDFNSFLNKYPNKGFYISQFPEIMTHMNSIYQKWGNMKEKFPLSLLEFRIFSKFHQIQFQLPTNENLDDSFAEIQEIISNEITLILTKENANFSHFIEFLLPKVPSFITKSFYSGYIRDILFSLVTVPKDNVIQQFIIEFIKEFLPKILNKIGSSEWENLIINKELKYETDDEIIRFLANPWKFVLEQIDQSIRPGYSSNFDAAKDVYLKMKTMVDSITTEKSIKELNKCVHEDIEFIKDRLIQDYNLAKNCIVTDQDVFNKWRIYSQQVSCFISLISPLPMSSMSKSSSPLLPGQSFDEFYDFFTQNLSSFSNNESRIIAFLPKKRNPDFVHKLQYTYNRKNVEIFFKITGKAMLFSIPYDTQIDSLNLVSTSLLYKVLKIKYNHFKSKLAPSIDAIIYAYKQFNEFNKRLSSNSSKVDECNRIQNEINQANVIFGGFVLDELIQKLNHIKSNLPDSFRNVQELNDATINLKKELAILTNIHYSNNEFSRPSNTINFLNKYLQINDLLETIDLNSFIDFLDCFPSFSNIYSELDQLLYDCNHFSLKPKNAKISFDEIDAQIDISNDLLSPVIFREGNSLKTTTKSIEINCDSLIFGVDLLPIQIRIFNFTDEEIICQFEQINEPPLPIYKNEPDFLIIEIPVEKICINEDGTEKEKTFNFKGKVLLSTKYINSFSTEIEYSIRLNYITPSDPRGLNSSSFEVKVNNYNSEVNNEFFASFPSKITIDSFYQKFNEILSFVYFLPSNIYEIISKIDNNNESIKILLNQLKIFYLWQKESSACFPFCSLQKKFNKALSLTLNKLHKINLNLSNFPHEMIHSKSFYDNFIQLPKLQPNEIRDFDGEKDELE